MPTFPDRLKELRASKGSTQKVMADLLKITDRNYRRYESGEADPTASKLQILADYFEVTVDYLLCRDDLTTNSSNNKEN